jgi:hypothetical protein
VNSWDWQGRSCSNLLTEGQDRDSWIHYGDGVLIADILSAAPDRVKKGIFRIFKPGSSLFKRLKRSILLTFLQHFLGPQRAQDP